jgi:LysM repeat protein
MTMTTIFSAMTMTTIFSAMTTTICWTTRRMRRMTTRRKTMKLETLLFLSAALLVAVGCDSRARQSEAGDRSSALYSSAMADYAAGQLDSAVKGLEKVIRTDPANAAARFQLATLMQDARGDYLSALALYRAYLFQCPTSEKVSLARERAQRCEQQFVRELLQKHGGSNDLLVVEKGDLKLACRQKDEEIARLKAALEKMTDACLAGKRENERLRRMVSSIGEGESTARPSIASEKELLELEEETVDRVKLSADIKNLIAEEKTELEAPPMPAAPKKAPVAAPQPPPSPRGKVEAKPATYVVQEGDTLSKLAIRFYGRRSAWRAIRDANKTVISVDGRITAGSTIVLP